MANKRIYQLQDFTSLDGLYFAGDKSGNSDAVRIFVDYILPSRCDSVVITAGSDLITFILPYSAAIDDEYEIPVLNFIDVNGDQSGGVVSAKTRFGFTFTSQYGGTLTYQTMLKM